MKLAVLILVCLCSAVCATPSMAGSTRSSYAARADVRAFARDMADETGIPAAQILRWLGKARYQAKIIAAMDRPLLAPPKWYEYRPQFLNDARIAAGVAFWNAHVPVLARAEREDGVPASIIVAILGIETYWGRNTGRFRALDALTTLAFDYPRRERLFRGELKEFLLLAREQQLDPTLPLGSFAGALGEPQFMPGSYRRFAVDYDGDGRIDLWHSAADVIGSVAHYLAEHDWQPGQPTLLGATVAPEARDAALARLDGGISERRTLAAWKDDGVVPVAPTADLADEPVGLLLLEDAPDAATLYVACQNFYVITRYNKSRLYASAVVQLADAIAAAR
jgi:membrane-bound lytic murein transglycosylase B